MNLRVANLIAVQFGIFIGIMSWLVFSRFDSAKPRTGAELQETAVAPAASSARVFEPRNPRAHTLDYAADRERTQTVDEEAAPTSQDYDQEIASEPYASSGRQDGSVVGAAPSYAQVDQEPAVARSDYLESPQTIAYAQPDQVVPYSNGRPFGNRRRSTRHSGELVSVIPRLPDTQVVPRLPDGQVVPRLPDTSVVPRIPDRAGSRPSVPFCRPTQGFGSRWNR